MRTRRLLDFSPGQNSIPCPGFPNSNRIISFADPHPLNPFTPYRYKNHRRWGAAPNLRTCKCAICIPDGVTGPCNLSTHAIFLSPLGATLTKMPLSVDSKGFTGCLTPLDATLTKNWGGAHPSSQDPLPLPDSLPVPRTCILRTIGAHEPLGQTLHGPRFCVCAGFRVGTYKP
jgi:hypothetical protein